MAKQEASWLAGVPEITSKDFLDIQWKISMGKAQSFKILICWITEASIYKFENVTCASHIFCFYLAQLKMWPSMSENPPRFFWSPAMLSFVCQKTYRNMKLAEQSWHQWDAILVSSLVPLGSLKTHNFFVEKSLTLRHEPQRNGSWKLTNTNSSDGTKHQTRGRSWGAPVKPASQSIRRFIFVEINCCECCIIFAFLCILYIVSMTSCINFVPFWVPILFILVSIHRPTLRCSHGKWLPQRLDAIHPSQNASHQQDW